MDALEVGAANSRARGTASPGGPGVLLGEIYTGLLQNAEAITSDVAAELLALIPQERVRIWERPIRHAASPLTLTGVDGDLPSISRGRSRAIGTVAAEARVTGGHLLQASSWVRVVPAQGNRRLPWSHYLTRPGVVEVSRGFLEHDPLPGVLDLGGVAASIMSSVQASAVVDHRPPFRVRRIRLRWAALPAAEGHDASIHFGLETDALRTVRIVCPPPLLHLMDELCQDIALHDWLLSTVVARVDVAHIGRRDRRHVMQQLGPAIDHLLHAWMPAARLGGELLDFWAEVERRSGLTRQWESTVRRIRDQVALATMDLANSGVLMPPGGPERQSPERPTRDQPRRSRQTRT
jgi:hypothetical protein